MHSGTNIADAFEKWVPLKSMRIPTIRLESQTLKKLSNLTIVKSMKQPMCCAVLSLQSGLTLHDPMGNSPPAPLSMGILLVRILE